MYMVQTGQWPPGHYSHLDLVELYLPPAAALFKSDRSSSLGVVLHCSSGKDPDKKGYAA